jgi:hypothetical protein
MDGPENVVVSHEMVETEILGGAAESRHCGRVPSHLGLRIHYADFHSPPRFTLDSPSIVTDLGSSWPSPADSRYGPHFDPQAENRKARSATGQTVVPVV